MSIPENRIDERSKISGVHIKSVNYVFILILSALIIVLFAIAHNIYSEYMEIEELAAKHGRIQNDAENVHEASDELTKDVQLFVVLGDTSFLDEYFKEAKETKRRESAIEDLRELKVSAELLKSLELSVEQSFALMQLEYKAMRYAAEGYHMDIASLPEEVRDIKLPDGSEALSDEDKIKQAEILVFGEEYYGYKNRIRNYEKECLDRALIDVENLKDAENKEMRNLLGILHVSLIILSLMGIFLFVVILRMVVNPLNRAVDKISSKNKIDPLLGTYEIKYMSHVYNEFHYDSVEIQKKLKREAERDSLTGVLNRRGHQTVIETLSSETFPIALLLVDIDDFKNVNDKYGHETGDTALKKLAQVLLETFRTTDITSRIGGDEFVVIMGDLTMANREVIEEKARIINELLGVPGPGKCPALSVSIGCAFSEVGYNDHLFNEADHKMYEVKREGGRGIRF